MYLLEHRIPYKNIINSFIVSNRIIVQKNDPTSVSKLHGSMPTYSLPISSCIHVVYTVIF